MAYFGPNIGVSPYSESIMEKIEAQQIEKRIFGNSVLAEVQGDLYKQYYPNATSPNNYSTNDKYTPSNVQKGADDGKIPFKEKVVNFGKGLVLPIKNMFSSPKNITITCASILGGAALIAATGGVAAPIMAGIGLVSGIVQIGKGIHKQATAKTDNEARMAWQQMGSGTFTTGVSAIAGKTSIKYLKGKNIPATPNPTSPNPHPSTGFKASMSKMFTSIKNIFKKPVPKDPPATSPIVEPQVNNPISQPVVEPPVSKPISQPVVDPAVSKAEVITTPIADPVIEANPPKFDITKFIDSFKIKEQFAGLPSEIQAQQFLKYFFSQPKFKNVTPTPTPAVQQPVSNDIFSKNPQLALPAPPQYLALPPGQ